MRWVLKMTKYLLIAMILIIFLVFFIFIYYSKKLNYEIPKTMSIELYDANGDKYLTLSNQNRKNYVKLEEISPYIIDSFLSIEDKKFYKHKGIDVMRMGGALLSNFKANDLKEGASTITQQYARSIYLTSSKNFKRKIEEIMISINLESKYSKDQILEGYLNSIYFDHGIYGIEDASLFYFDKHASEVTLAEAAILTAIPKGPIYYSPINNPENNKNRKNLILEELYEDKKITIDQLQNAKKEIVNFYGHLDSIDPNKAPYYQDLIIEELKNIPAVQRHEGGIKVYTTLDLNLSRSINENISKYMPDDEELQIAIVAMDPHTGDVLSIIGGKDYTKSQFNRATKALRQPGSTIKPFLYYSALNNGFTPATTFESTKTTFFIDGQTYSPTNYLDIYPDRDVTMAYALAVSDNIYAIKTHLFLGTDVLFDTLKNFGFTSNINNNVSLALGSSEVYLDELVNGYAQIASLGKEIKPRYIKKITDLDDNILYEQKVKPEQKFDADNCYILSETMNNVFDNRLAININTTGAAISSKLHHKYAAKSGSTDTDNLIIGYNSDLVLGIWTGYDDNKLIINNETKYIKFIWADVMEEFMKGKSGGWYEPSNGVVSIELNPISGQIAKKSEYKKELYFKADNLPWFIFE